MDAEQINEHATLTADNERLRAENERLKNSLSLSECVSCGIRSFEWSPFENGNGFCWNCKKLASITEAAINLEALK